MSRRERVMGTIRKRLTRTTYEPYNYDFDTYLTQATNPYNDESTFREIYEGEPIARGIVDTQVDCVFSEYDWDFMRKKPRKNEEKTKDEYMDWTSRPDVRFNQKVRSMATKLVLDNMFYLEVDPEAENFYVLNKENCELKWNKENTAILGINWWKNGAPSYSNVNTEKARFIPIEKCVIGSYHDPDTNLWQSAPMRSLIESANILFHARAYNNDIFRSGGMPSFAYIFKQGITKDVFKKTVKEANHVKAGKNLFFKADVDIKQIGGFNKDMEYSDLMRSAIQDFMTALRNSPLMTNLWDKKGGEDKNEFNAFSEKIHTMQSIMNDSVNEVIWKIFVQKVHKTWTDDINKTFNDDRLEAEFKLEKVRLLKEKRADNPYKKVKFKLRKWVDLRLLSAVQKIWLDTGVISPNEARGQLGFEPREGGDKFLTDIEGAGQQMGNSGGANPSGTQNNQVKEPKASESEKKPSASQQATEGVGTSGNA